MYLVMNISLGQEGDVVLIDRLWEALSPIEVRCCARISFHDRVDDGTKEPSGTDIFSFGSLHKDAEIHSGCVLIVRVFLCRAVESETK